jgi:mannose-6-phosphate isomerase-like protein (cupin superfamily)
MSQTHVIVNPLSGERIMIRRTAAESGGAVLDWELLLAPGGRVPSAHAHPEQTETFTVLEGRMKFRVGWRRMIATPGQCVHVPPGTVHHFANAGRVPARIAVESRPALAMEELLETAAALAQEQHAAGRALPRPLELALFMTDFDREVRAPFLPRGLVRLVMRALARLAMRHGLDARYRRLRQRGPALVPVTGRWAAAGLVVGTVAGQTTMPVASTVTRPANGRPDYG